jgi:hypothetical protein
MLQAFFQERTLSKPAEDGWSPVEQTLLCGSWIGHGASDDLEIARGERWFHALAHQLVDYCFADEAGQAQTRFYCARHPQGTSVVATLANAPQTNHPECCFGHGLLLDGDWKACS